MEQENLFDEISGLQTCGGFRRILDRGLKRVLKTSMYNEVDCVLGVIPFNTTLLSMLPIENRIPSQILNNAFEWEKFSLNDIYKDLTWYDIFEDLGYMERVQRRLKNSVVAIAELKQEKNADMVERDLAVDDLETTQALPSFEEPPAPWYERMASLSPARLPSPLWFKR